MYLISCISFIKHCSFKYASFESNRHFHVTFISLHITGWVLEIGDRDAQVGIRRWGLGSIDIDINSNRFEVRRLMIALSELG